MFDKFVGGDNGSVKKISMKMFSEKQSMVSEDEEKSKSAATEAAKTKTENGVTTITAALAKAKELVSGSKSAPVVSQKEVDNMQQLLLKEIPPVEQRVELLAKEKLEFYAPLIKCEPVTTKGAQPLDSFGTESTDDK